MSERNWRTQEEQQPENSVPERATFEQTASGFGINPELLDNPAVRQFVALANGLENMQAEAAILKTRPVGKPGDTTSLDGRYDAVDLLLRSALHILGEGFNQREPIASSSLERNYLKNKIAAVVRRYGLDVVEEPQEPQKDVMNYGNLSEPPFIREK
jgi:hypothetical protein